MLGAVKSEMAPDRLVMRDAYRAASAFTNCAIAKTCLIGCFSKQALQAVLHDHFGV